MSDRGRNRRPARSTKATPPNASAPDASAEAEESSAAVTDEQSAAEQVDSKQIDSEQGDSGQNADEPAAVSAETDADASGGDVPEDGDAPEESEESETTDKSDKSAKSKSKTAAPLTKAEQRAAARVAAAKSARRRRTGQAIAGTLIVLLAIGGAFTGVWYFGNRAEEQKTLCKKPVPKASSTSNASPAPEPYPPMLGGFDKRLAEEPKTEAGKESNVGVRHVDVLIQGDCKTVKPGDTIVVNYVGLTYKDGKVFDSSWQHKQTFPVEVGLLEQKQQPRVIEGWDRGLVGLKVGSRVILDIPAREGYGDVAQRPGDPVGDLRFYVDILDIESSDASGGLTIPGAN
ncbi:FKBP-type peptidyl-prolyl cis-trans isomerase [Dactylosporangium sp. NPDC000555]|uniref:FKBP-type peptidyl-prolyl cis-trans isomerase n=1 Tax=Dactylosporangium sp. NPDC000555 TaxID=3154260 RepID=UPI00332E7C3A